MNRLDDSVTLRVPVSAMLYPTALLEESLTECVPVSDNAMNLDMMDVSITLSVPASLVLEVIAIVADSVTDSVPVSDVAPVTVTALDSTTL